MKWNAIREKLGLPKTKETYGDASCIGMAHADLEEMLILNTMDPHEVQMKRYWSSVEYYRKLQVMKSVHGKKKGEEMAAADVRMKELLNTVHVIDLWTRTRPRELPLWVKRLQNGIDWLEEDCLIWTEHDDAAGDPEEASGW